MGDSREPAAGATGARGYSRAEPPRVWDVRVDFNTYPGPGLVYGNARHARPGVDVHVGAVLTLGDDDWGTVRAEIVEFDEATGSFMARLIGDLVPVDEDAPSVAG